MIRTVFVQLNVVFSFLLLVFPQAFCILLDPTGDLAHCVARLWGRWILFCSGTRVRVRGRGNIQRGRPQIFFSNHKSYFDVYCLLAHLPAQYRWLAKEELFHIPVFGRAMALGGYIPIDRSNPRKALESMSAAAERIRQGTSLLIFPEGTRSHDGRLQSLKTGGAVLAIQARVPVVPVAILGTERILPKGSLRVGRGRVEIRIGKPIETEGLGLRDKRKLVRKVRQAIMEMLEDVGPRPRWDSEAKETVHG